MEVWIDNRYFKVDNNYTIFQYCAKIGINLPCFCYHERLSIAGNCRMCLVEANNSLVVSCATLLLDNMNISTKSKRIKKAREGVLEFLLVNHPLDCPICDQGGECDLQDILMIYGSDRGRFYELNKRSVTNLNCAGPFIKTVMTRCIHCTRCVRFVNEISSVFDYGIIGRGSSMEIGTYIENFINDELLGNIIDLCPVGALVSMPSSFVGRSWELNYVQSIDVLDSIGTGIKIAVSNNNVMRVIPSIDQFYDEWITNKARFVYDSFNNQRLYYPKLRLFLKFVVLSWRHALVLFLHSLYNKREGDTGVYCGAYASLGCSITLKSFLQSFGCSQVDYCEKSLGNIDFRSSFLLNITMRRFPEITTLILVGANPRLEVPLLNSVLRKNFLNNFQFRVYSFGLGLEYLTYPVINLGSSVKSLYKFFMGFSLVSNYLINNDFYNYAYFSPADRLAPFFFMGSSNLLRLDKDGLVNSLLSFLHSMGIPISNFSVINRHLGRISLNEIGLAFTPKPRLRALKGLGAFNFILGLDSIQSVRRSNGDFVVFQGSFYISNFFDKVSLILPTSIYTEGVFSYVNLEGRFRSTNKAVSPFKFVFSDIAVLESLSVLLRSVYKENFSVIPKFYQVLALAGSFSFYLNYLCNLKSLIVKYLSSIYNKSRKGTIMNLSSFTLNNTVFSKVVYNYYSDEIFSKKSKVLTIMSYKVKFINFEDKIKQN